MRGRWSQVAKAQQKFLRARNEIWDLMSETDSREFMLQAVDPDPVIDWQTGLTLGSSCPRQTESIT